MPLEVTSFCAGVVTLFATERLLSTVNHNVDLQMRSINGLVSALVATVGLLFIMLLMHVCCLVFLRIEGDIALNTFVFILHFNRLVTILIVQSIR